MKRVFSFLSFLFISFLMQAQEKAQEAEQVLEDDGRWSTGTKMTLLIVWGFVVLWLTARTFRNKADM